MTILLGRLCLFLTACGHEIEERPVNHEMEEQGAEIYIYGYPLVTMEMTKVADGPMFLPRRARLRPTPELQTF